MPRLTPMQKAEMSARLREARLEAGYPETAQAAVAIGAAIPTYTHHENGGRGFLHEVPRYARFFGVSDDWLAYGKGEKRRVRDSGAPVLLIAIDGVVGAGPAVSLVSDEQAAALGEIPMPGDGHLGGLIVEGDSQQPRWRRGEVIVYDRRSTPPEDLVGCYAVVVTADGDRLVKIIRRGVGMNRWRLDSHNADPIDNVFLIGAHRVVATIHRHPASLEDELPAPVLPKARRARPR